MGQSSFLTALLAIFSLCDGLWGIQWTEGKPLPDSQAFVRTVAQIMEQAADKKDAPIVTVKKIEELNNVLEKLPRGFLNFTAARFEDSGMVPPDAMGAVGPKQFLLASNGLLRSFDKETGRVDHVLNVSMNLFFSSVSEGGATSDPQIRYDRYSDRWFVVILAIDDKRVRLALAVSDGGVITATSRWSFFSFVPRSSASADYPTLGIDSHAVYLGFNILDSRQYVTSDAFVIPKAPLLEGKLKIFAFPDLVAPYAANFAGPISPQAVDNFDPDANEGYFIGIDGMGNRLMLRRIKNPSGLPAISDNIPIAIENGAFPLKVPQAGSIGSGLYYLQGFDKRLCNTHIRNKILYTAHNVAVDNKGIAETATPTRDALIWYAISLQEPDKPTIVQSNMLFQPSATNDLDERYYWMPGMMTNGLETLLVSCSTASNKEYANAAYALHFSNDPPGYLSTPHLYTSSHFLYTLGFFPFKWLRWGEYSHPSVDPSDNMTFWSIGEFALESASWGLQVVRIPAPPPAKIRHLDPAQIEENLNNVPLTIVGERQKGSAFYDPGVGFPNHLKVEIEGVTIVSTKWINATQIDLIISTVGSTPDSNKDIIITNPDGQVVTTKGLLRITPKEPL